MQFKRKLLFASWLLILSLVTLGSLVTLSLRCSTKWMETSSTPVTDSDTSERSALYQKSSTMPVKPGCPLPIHHNIGVSTRNPLNDTILVTAANIQFYPMLQNWEHYASLHGYKWVVLCMDTELYDRISDSGRAILLPPDHQDGKIAHYGTQQYTKLVCSKVLMIIYLIQQCGSNLNILFSDSDLVILRDFLDHDFGAMIRTLQYDYIYQYEFLPRPPEPRQDWCSSKRRNFMGNTGFYFLRPTPTMVELLHTTLGRCVEEGQELDDQVLFWRVMNEFLKARRVRHCQEYNLNTMNASKHEICCLDPYYYRTGQFRPEKPEESYIVHANFVSGMKNKTELLAEYVDGWETRDG